MKAFKLAQTMVLKNDFIMVLEDHARPFSHHSREYFVNSLKALTKNWHPNSPILYLGAHAIKTTELPQLETGVTNIRLLAGTYGFLIHTKFLMNFTLLLDNSVTNSSNRDSLSPDVLLSIYKPVGSQHNCIATPLLIDHLQNTYSITWKIQRGAESWAGYDEVRAHLS